ncbi:MULTISPECIES: LysR family transcriptional regulator [unclassified Rhizobium]|uniref:LysR family transcriptional regulator n=1 Tax=unclassified Rhizobium TaxID=2613769 RepID=UPI001C833964|nr:MULTISPECIES: LysR family transcriptional regulator [unclassified Rhizobium]MBX5166883.1 LysR family transcriptional regulator [Rhizobium sp. NZLR4b]MBX5186286.1 LysR family transcriptional regulator [Rhizobium sp. NZLR5]
MKRIDLNLLVSLEALLVERNVTRAAARLYMSQPALSAQLNRLRDLFKDPLLVPAHRGMVPTAKALDLIGPLRASLDQLRGTLQNHDSFSPATAELTISIACTDYVEAAVVAPLIVALREKAPNIRLAVHRLAPARLAQQLADGDVDLAIATPDDGQTHLRTRHLFEESYILIGRSGHPRIAQGATPSGFARLEQVIVSPSGGGFSTPVDATLMALGHSRAVVASAASFLVVPSIVASSDLVALVPRRLMRNRLAEVAWIDVPWLSERFQVELIWHERTHAHQGQQWIREQIHFASR